MGNELIHILLVEDDDVDIAVIERAFKKHEIINPLVCAPSGKEALSMLRGEDGYSRLSRPISLLPISICPR